MPTVQNFGEAILTSLNAALALVFTFVPKLVGFLVILLIGWLIATAISKGLTFILRRVGFDRLAERIGMKQLEQRMGVALDPAALLGQIAYWFVFLIFLVPAVDALGLTSVSGILNTLIAYIPNVFVAIIVLFLGTLAANFVADIVQAATQGSKVGDPVLFANIARYAIMGFIAIIALEQLQIAPALLNILFTAFIGAVALAFGLAFGLGGRETAQRILARSEHSLISVPTPPAASNEIDTSITANTL